MSANFAISPLKPDSRTIGDLAEILIETVANGGSVSFMHPVDMPTAVAFWANSLAAATRGERVVLGAYDGDTLVGTVTLLLIEMPNQPHRAELAKMMTRVAHRRRGVARALVAEAERLAVHHGRWLVTLDTAVDEGAGGFYEALGYQRAGIIPDYAFKPLGGLTGTIFFWKRLNRTPA